VTFDRRQQYEDFTPPVFNLSNQTTLKPTQKPFSKTIGSHIWSATIGRDISNFNGRKDGVNDSYKPETFSAA